MTEENSDVISLIERAMALIKSFCCVADHTAHHLFALARYKYKNMCITLLVTFYQNMKHHSGNTMPDIRRIFFSPKRPYWVWDPCSCLTSEHCAAVFTGHGVSSSDKVENAWSGTSTPHISSRRTQGHLYLYL